MKRLLLFLFLSLFLLNFVFASNCQYTKIENYSILEEGLYDSGGEYFGPSLEFRNFSGGSMNIQGCNPPSFRVHNPTGENIVLNISYQTSWKTAFGSRSVNHRATISINKYSVSEKLKGSCPDIGSGSIHSESINYDIFEPKEIFLQNKLVTKQKEICRMCDNEICLNEGASCNPLYDDSKCGSEICNIAGFCGNKKIVDCPKSHFNCNNKQCLKLDSVDFPNNVEKGCEDACIFGGEKGICSENPVLIKKRKDIAKRTWIIFGVIVLLVLSTGVGYLAFFKRIREENKRNEIKKEKETLEKQISELKESKEFIEKDISKLKKYLEESKNKIKELESQIKYSKGKAKEELEKRLKNEERKQKEKINDLKRKKEDLNQEEKNMENLKNTLLIKKEELNKEIEEISKSSPERRIRKLKNKYHEKYGHRHTKIFYDDGRKSFRIIYPDGRTYDLYWDIYRNKIDSNLIGKHIHHINYDELIDEPWNLIALSEKEHNKILHKNIDKGNWDSGIKEIKRALNWKDSDFPKHIQKKIQERRQQKKLNAHHKKSRKGKYRKK